MAITSKQAYEIASKELGNDFRIYCCTELSDCWIFAFQLADGTGICDVPPVQVKKDGTCDLWDKRFSDAIEGSDWLRENGKNIPISELKD